MTTIGEPDPEGDSDLAADARQVALVLVIEDLKSELLDLRGSAGRLTVGKLSKYPGLVRALGDGDHLAAYQRLNREFKRYRTADTHQIAAVWAIAAAFDTALDRLGYAADQLATDPSDCRDQRTTRRWSDHGIELIARDMTAFAVLAGRLGQEVLAVTLQDADEPDKIRLAPSTATSTSLPAVAPTVTVEYWPGTSSALQQQIDLDEHTAEDSDEEHMIRVAAMHLRLPSPPPDSASGQPVLRVLIYQRGGLGWTVIVEDERVGDRYTARYALQAVSCQIDVMAKDD